MKHQALFPQKDKSKKKKCRLLQFWFGALRVKKPSKIAADYTFIFFLFFTFFFQGK